ncbi:hypothetical protein [Novosphingobium aquimarinum]|uniref:hypothetical protein n=1 Tax=Novosphingobium aquimarinum TaxID=2682494 RepID=UPI0012ECB448|nr:hypothetical protein [Novosphingobium aquimarinum]
MSSATAAKAVKEDPFAALTASSIPVDPGPVIAAGRRSWPRWLGTIISFAVLVAALYNLHWIELSTLQALLPSDPRFWLVYAAYYLLGPVSEWIIFRRLWNLPPSGIVPLLRKKVSNELLLGYLGELYFYSWARRHANLVAAPFGAIKDVTIISAMTGNAITLTMLLFAAPWLLGLVAGLDLDVSQQAIAYSTGFIALSSLLVFVFRRRVLSLPKEELRFVFLVHGARAILNILLLATLWHLALPLVALLWWAILSLTRQLVSRLPFVPNKDVIFASLAIFFVGGDGTIPALMTLIAGIVLLTHLIVGAVTSGIEIVHNLNREAA